MTTKTFHPSRYQRAIYDAMKSGTGNIAVSAVPGSGKTTTVVNAMLGDGVGKTLYLAFNRSIVDDVAPKIGGVKQGEKWVFPADRDAFTFHSFGNRILSAQRFGQIKEQKYAWIFKDMMAALADDHPLAKYKDNYGFQRDVLTLAEKARLMLIDVQQQTLLIDLAAQFDITSDAVYHPANPVGDLISAMLDEGIARFKQTGQRDLTDMVWLPVVMKLTSPDTYDWLFIDECQDLEEVKRRFATDVVLAKRVLAVGDPRQAIMGFTGASFNSFDLVVDALQASVLPLSVCYRCPKSAIDIANSIFPGIEARDNAPAGIVRVDVSVDEIATNATAGDLILCRLNAPLVKHCIALIMAGKKANIRGRDIGQAFCDKLDRIAKRDGFDFSSLTLHISEFREEQIALLRRKNVREDTIRAQDDLFEALLNCASMFNATDLKDLKAKISDMFADAGAQIWFSSVHRSKGLEARRVMILEPALLPFIRLDDDGQPTQTFDEITQEMNLYYVAVTRPLEELWFFGTPSPTAFPAHAVAGGVPVVIPELETKAPPTALIAEVAAPPAPAPAVVQPPAPVASPAAPATARASKTKSALIQLLNDHDLSERALRELLARAQSYLD